MIPGSIGAVMTEATCRLKAAMDAATVEERQTEALLSIAASLVAMVNIELQAEEDFAEPRSPFGRLDLTDRAALTAPGKDPIS
jgi:hypothetical protein